MSIQTQIDRIDGNVKKALAKIAEKGVAVADNANSDDLESLIAAIESGGGGGNGISPFGTIVAMGSFVPSENILDEYVVDTGFAVGTPFEQYTYGAIVYRTDSYETDNTDNVFNSLYFSMLAYVSGVGITARKLSLTSGFGNTGNLCVSGTSYGRISGVDRLDTGNIGINFKSLSYGNNYTICLRAGLEYKWVIMDNKVGDSM